MNSHISVSSHAISKINIFVGDRQLTASWLLLALIMLIQWPAKEDDGVNCLILTFAQLVYFN